MATLSFVKPWPNGEIPYEINHPEKDQIKKVIDLVNVTTVIIKFREKKDDDKNYVCFRNANENVVYNEKWNPPYKTSDVLGFCEGKTYVYLKSNPWLALHEICHVIGLIHEHQRSDRNKYLANVGNRGADCRILTESLNQKLHYDGQSVTHYGLSWQDCDAKWIDGKNPGQQWKYLTVNDVKSIYALYIHCFPSSTPGWADVWCRTLELPKTTDKYNHDAGKAIRGAYRLAKFLNYSAALPNFHSWRTYNGVHFFGKEVDVYDVNHKDLNLKNPTDQYDSKAGEAIRNTHDYATKKGYLSGFPNFEAYYENCGVVHIKKEVGELKTVNYKNLGLDHPIYKYDKNAGVAIRQTHDYAFNLGYLTGFPNFKGKNDQCEIILIKRP